MGLSILILIESFILIANAICILDEKFLKKCNFFKFKFK